MRFALTAVFLTFCLVAPVWADTKKSALKLYPRYWYDLRAAQELANHIAHRCAGYELDKLAAYRLRAKPTAKMEKEGITLRSPAKFQSRKMHGALVRLVSSQNVGLELCEYARRHHVSGTDLGKMLEVAEQ